MVNDALSGVELLALYGDDDRLGAVRVPRFLKRAARYAPAYHIAKGAMRAGRAVRKKMHGDERVGNEDTDNVESLGAVKKRRFLPGLAKVGKVTRGFTSGVASAFVPKSTLDLLSKIDPTKKKTTVKSAVAALTPKEVVPVKKEAMKIDTKKIAIIGGGALGALVLLRVLTAPRKG